MWKLLINVATWFWKKCVSDFIDLQNAGPRADELFDRGHDDLRFVVKVKRVILLSDKITRIWRRKA